MGQPPPQRGGPDQAEPLPGHAPGGLGEPAGAALRVADPAQGRLRRVRAGRRGPARLDDRRRPPLHHPVEPAEGQHDGRDGPRPAGRRGRAPRAARRRAARPRPPGVPDGAAGRGTGLPAGVVGRRARPRGGAHPRGGRGPLRALHDRPRDHERGLLHRRQGDALPRLQQRRQRRQGLPRPVDGGPEDDGRRRGHHDLLHRPDGLRPRRALRLRRGQRPAGRHEVPLHRPPRGHEGGGGEPVPGARPRALLGPVQRRERPVRHQDGRRLLPGEDRRRHRLHRRAS